MNKVKGIPVAERLFRRTEGGLEPGASRCKKCGKLYFPVKKVCPQCFDDGCLETVPLPQKGKLLAYSIAHSSLIGIPAPYAFGYIELEGGLIIYSLLADCFPAEERLKPGMEMELVMDVMSRDQSGNKVVAFKYRPRGARE